MSILNEDGSIRKFKDIHGVIKNMEYRYLEYQVSDGYVVKITNEVPVVVGTGHKIAISDNVNFEEGYEFDNYIVVQSVDEMGNLTSSCMIKQPDSVKFLRQERDKLVEENASLKKDLVAIQDVVMGLMDLAMNPMI
jgi:hypothetical protein